MGWPLVVVAGICVYIGPQLDTLAIQLNIVAAILHITVYHPYPETALFILA